MTTFTKEQAKAQLIELIQVRLADFIKERLLAHTKLYEPDGQEGFFYEAVKRMGWTEDKVGLNAMHLSVCFSVHIEKQGEEGVGVSYVTMSITPSIRVEERDFVTGRPTGLSNQGFRECGSMPLNLRVVS